MTFLQPALDYPLSNGLAELCPPLSPGWPFHSISAVGADSEPFDSNLSVNLFWPAVHASSGTGVFWFMSVHRTDVCCHESPIAPQGVPSELSGLFALWCPIPSQRHLLDFFAKGEAGIVFRETFP